MRHCIVAFEVLPNESAGPLRFRMTQEQVERRLGAGAPTLPRDTFTRLGLRVHYGPDSLAEAFAFTGPASPVFLGQDLLRRRIGDLEAWLASIDPGIKLDHSGVTSLRFGLRIYAASARRHPHAVVESVTVFAPEHGRRYMVSVMPPAACVQGARQPTARCPSGRSARRYRSRRSPF
jgi:hypothetical protein